LLSSCGPSSESFSLLDFFLFSTQFTPHFDLLLFNLFSCSVSYVSSDVDASKFRSGFLFELTPSFESLLLSMSFAEWFLFQFLFCVVFLIFASLSWSWSESNFFTSYIASHVLRSRPTMAPWMIKNSLKPVSSSCPNSSKKNLSLDLAKKIQANSKTSIMHVIMHFIKYFKLVFIIKILILCL
jgi:hypothetical protein